MKLKNIIIIISIVIISIMTTISNATYSIDTADIYIKERAKTCLKLTSNGGAIGVTKVFYKHNGVEYPAYCVNPELDGVGEVPGYQVTINDVVNNPQIWRVITQGYPYKSLEELGVLDEDEAYTATKQAVYCVINNYDLSRYGAVGEAGERTLNAMTKMVNYARTSSATKPSANIIINEKSEWEVDETNKNILKTFEIYTEVEAPEYEISINNNIEDNIKILNMNGEQTNKITQKNFIVSIPINILKQDGKFEISVKAKLATYPILYGSSGSATLQNYALAGEIYETGEGKVEVSYNKNTTRVKIIKTDDKENKLEGVEFNILDEENNIKYSNLKTNENGEVIIEGILPGKYYLEETSTINGYSKLKEKVEFEVELNEELVLTIENNKIPEQNKKEKKYSEKLEKLPVTGK